MDIQQARLEQRNLKMGERRTLERAACMTVRPMSPGNTLTLTWFLDWSKSIEILTLTDGKEPETVGREALRSGIGVDGDAMQGGA